MFDPRNLQITELLALTIWGEARGEPIEGQVAVANVIKNRVSDGSDYYDVILKAKQFSCWNSDDKNYPKLIEMGNEILRYGASVHRNNMAFMQCYVIADLIRHDLAVDNTKGARNYLAISTFRSPERPSWSAHPTNITALGNQVFFNV